MHPRTNHPSRVAIGLAALVALAGTAEAQRSAAQRSGSAAASTRHAATDDRTVGLSLGAYTLAAPGVSITGADIDGTFSTTMGEGLGVLAQYGLNKTFSLFASLDVAKQQTGADVTPAGSFGLAHFEIGGRARFRVADPRTIPYVSASLGRRALAARATDQDTGEQADVSLSGGMFAFGGGVERVLSPKLSLDGGVEFGFGSFDHYSVDGDQGTNAVNGSTSVRLRVGLNWHP